MLILVNLNTINVDQKFPNLRNMKIICRSATNKNTNHYTENTTTPPAVWDEKAEGGDQASAEELPKLRHGEHVPA